MSDEAAGPFPPDQPNPWRRLARRAVYDNPWMSVVEDRVIRPDGREGIYGVVAPTHLALGVVALDADEHVWLVGQYRYTLGRYSWEIPEGGGDPRLDPREEAARELREETGLTARRWTHLMTLHTSNCFTSERAELYLAESLSPGRSDPDDSEQLQLARVPLGRAVEAIHAGRITDALSVAGLLAVARARGL